MQKYFRISFIAGLISASISFIYFVGSNLFGINPLGGSKAFGYILMVILFFPALWYFRKNYLNNEMHFHQAFALAFLMNLFACLLFCLFIWVDLSFIDPNLIVRHITESKLFFSSIKDDFVKTNSLEAFNISLASLDKLTIGDIVYDEFKKRFLIISFFVLLVSFVMRRSPSWAVSK